MESKNKQPEYPCFDITDEDRDVLAFSALRDNLLHSLDEMVIDKYWLNHFLVDCRGDVYKIVGAENLARWRRFVPCAAKAKLITEYTGKQVDLEVLRAHMIRRYDSLDWEDSEIQDIYEVCREKIIKAQNFKELMM